MADIEPSRVKPNIVTFWHGPALHPIYRLCLASQVRLGFSVTVYSYGPLAGLPAGARSADAEAILPLAVLDRLRSRNPAADPKENRHLLQFSDLFRMRLQREGLGVWLDADIFLLRPFEIDPAMPFFGRESRKFLGNAVLYLPTQNPIVGEFEQLLTTPDLRPDWLPPRLRLRKLWWDLTNVSYRPGDLSTVLYGPLALTQLAKRHGLETFAFDSETFYTDDTRFFDPSDVASVLADPRIVGIHLKAKRRSEDPPLAGSLYEWALREIAL